MSPKKSISALTLPQIGRLARWSVLAALGRERSLKREILRGISIPQKAVREAFLQLVLFAGYPRAINALFLVPDPIGRLRPSRGTVASRRRRGECLCRRIYGPDFGPLMGAMERLHPALAEGILEEGYGRVLSRPGLSPRERELILVPVLAATRAWRQLPGHLRGARRVGASWDEIRRVIGGIRDLLDRSARRALDYAVRSERGRYA